MSDLPQVTTSHVLSRKSVIRFRDFLAQQEYLFEFRETGEADLGVDASIEAIADGEATNFKCDVQIKATAQFNSKKKKAVSVKIKKSNINYLLNAPLGLYIVFVESSNVFYYDWALSVYDKACSSGAWHKRKDFNISFNTVLTPQALKNIHAKTIDSGKRIVETRGAVLSVPTGSMPDANNYDHESNDLLLNGINLCVSGNAKLVSGKYEKLLPGKKSDNLRLIGAYSYFMQFRYLEAKCEINRIDTSLLARGKDVLYCVMKSAIDYQMGTITNAEYAQAMSAIISMAPKSESLEQSIYAIQQQTIYASSTADMDDLARKALSVIKEMRKSDKYDEVVMLYAELVYLNLSGVRIISEAGTLPWIIDFQAGMRPGGVNEKYINNAINNLDSWRDNIEHCIEKTIIIKNPLLLGEAYYQRANCNSSLYTLKTLQETRGVIQKSSDVEICNKIESDIGLAKSIFESAHHLAGVFRFGLVEMEYLVIRGNEDQAAVLAKSMLKSAQINGLSFAYGVLQEYAEKRSRQSMMLRNFLKRNELTQDEILLSMTCEDIKKYIDMQIRINGIPEDRRRNMEISVEALVGAAKERRSHCKYLLLEENTLHQRSIETLFREDVERYCRCALKGVQSIFGNANWNAVLLAFKGANCATCKGNLLKYRFEAAGSIFREIAAPMTE